MANKRKNTLFSKAREAAYFVFLFRLSLTVDRYPKEIEDFLYTHPVVRDVQVIGLPDKQYSEEAMQ